MSFAVANTIASALVGSRLDYCNSLYHNIALKDILTLQRVKKNFARFVTRSLRFISLSTIASHYFKDLYNYLSSIFIQAPAYLHSLHTHARQPRPFRSSNSNLFFFPVLRQMSEQELVQLLHQFCGTHSLLVLSM